MFSENSGNGFLVTPKGRGYRSVGVTELACGNDVSALVFGEHLKIWGQFFGKDNA